MITKEEQKVRSLIDQATRPLRMRIDTLEKEARRLKSDVSNLKNVVRNLKK